MNVGREIELDNSIKTRVKSSRALSYKQRVISKRYGTARTSRTVHLWRGSCAGIQKALFDKPTVTVLNYSVRFPERSLLLSRYIGQLAIYSKE
jgi:hypothetical protein